MAVSVPIANAARQIGCQYEGSGSPRSISIISTIQVMLAGLVPAQYYTGVMREDRVKNSRNSATSSRAGGDKASFRVVLVVALALAMGTVAAYWGVMTNNFINWDDSQYVSDNPSVNQGLSWASIRWAFTTFHAANWHPLTWISHMVDSQVFGSWAGGHHLVSLGFHTASVILLLAFLYYTTGYLWASALVAGLFALHPLHVESVAWAAERKDVLSTFFWLVTMLVYTFYARKPGVVRYLVVVLFFAAGLMSKPMVVTLPFVLLLLDYWPLRRFTAGNESDEHVVKAVTVSRLLIEKTPLIAMSACSAVITLMAQQSAMSTVERVGRMSCVMNALVSCWRYIWEMVWPARLAVLYPFSLQSQYVQAVVALAGLAAVTITALYWGKRFGYLAVGWLWYLGTLVPVIGIIQVGAQSHADRYTYVPLIGLFLIIGWGAADIVRRIPSLQWAVAGVSVAALVAAGFMTAHQVRYWKDSVTLFTRTVAVTKDNSMAEKNLANALLNAGQLEESMVYYRKALDREPGMKEAQLGMAYALVRLGRAGEALPYSQKALELDGNWVEAYDVRGMILGDIGRFDESITVFEKTLTLRHDMTQTYYNMATVYVRKGDMTKAVETYQRCISVKPESQTYSLLGGLMAHLGRLDEAEASFREAARIKPDLASTHYELGMLLAHRGRGAEAVVELKRAMALEPQNEKIQAYYRDLTGVAK
jgi:tetratricopeptide (TPR) repeat protein